MIERNPQKFRNIDNKVVDAINFYTKSSFYVEEGKGETDMDMCYASQTAEARAIIKAFYYTGKTLNETIDYIMSQYDKITEEYITEKYNSFSSK